MLFLASWRDRPKCVKMLLNRGASPEMTDDLGCSPLIGASWAGAVEAVAELTGSKLGDALPRLRATSRALAVKSAESTFSAIDEINRPRAGHARSK